MKKILLLVGIILLSINSNAQPDLVVDSLNVAKTLRVHEFTASNSQLFCPDPHDVIHPGYNITLTWQLDIANLGNMNAHLGCGDGSTPGVEYDSCRGYNYYEGFCEFTVTDASCNVLARTEKAYYAIATSQHYLATAAPGFAERLAWLERQCNCTIDVAYFNSLPDTSDGTTLCPVLGPGYMDRYGVSQFGNWLNIETTLHNLVVGQTYYFEAELYPEGVTNESNVFQNTSGKIPFVWNGIGADGKNSLSVPPGPISPLVCCEDPVLSAPTGLKVTQQTRLSWDAVQWSTGYRIYAADPAYQPGTKKIIGYHSPPVQIGYTHDTFFSLPATSGKLFYFVTAKNCAGESAKSIPIVR